MEIAFTPSQGNMKPRILCCGLFPALQRTLQLATLTPGTVNRVQCPAGVSVGGKAVNTARVLKTLGAEPVLTGLCGGDTGTAIKRLLDAEGLTHAFVQTVAASRLCQTLLTDDAEAFTELVEEGAPLTGDESARLAATVQTLLPAMDAMVVSGTLPAHIHMRIYAGFMPSAGGPPVVLDTSGPPLHAALAGKPVLVKINVAELFATVAASPPETPSGTDIERAAQELLAQGAQAVGVTQGAADAWLVTPARTFQFAVPAVRVVNTLGCGDAVNAGVVLALLRGECITEAFAYGLACGGANAMHRQPGVIAPMDVTALCKRIRPHHRQTA